MHVSAVIWVVVLVGDKSLNLIPRHLHSIMNKSTNNKGDTVAPVYNGPVLSGHPLLSGQFSKSRLFAHTNTVFVTCIRRPPLLSGRGHPVAVLCLSFFVIFTCIKRPPLNGNEAICYFMRYFIVFKVRSSITIKK